MILYFQIQCDCGAWFTPFAMAHPVVETSGTCPNCLATHVVTMESRPAMSVPDDLSSLDQ